jgi:hypothetical protein
MAVEAKRGCGYRKVGGLYLVADEGGYKCDRLPLEMTVCPCCGEGIRQLRSWRWIDPIKLLPGDHNAFDPGYCGCPNDCPACHPIQFMDPENARAGLLWIGEAFYATPEDFLQEGAQLGISRRISTLPNDFRVGHTWVFLGHPKACEPTGEDPDRRPGIFCAFRPKRLERIVKQSDLETFKKVVKVELRCFSEFEYEASVIAAAKLAAVGPEGMKVYAKLQLDVDRGIRLVPVPDDDPDHQGRKEKSNE